MTDIVERLRGEIPHCVIESHWTVDFEALYAERKEAADEIERLREELEWSKTTNGQAHTMVDSLTRDIELKKENIQRLEEENEAYMDRIRHLQYIIDLQNGKIK